MDFRNEALNALRMKELLNASEFADREAIIIPEPHLPLTTRSAIPSKTHLTTNIESTFDSPFDLPSSLAPAMY